MPPKKKKEIARLKAELKVARTEATKHQTARVEAEKASEKHQRSVKRLENKAQLRPSAREEHSGCLGGLDKALKDSGSGGPIRGQSSGPPGKPTAAAAAAVKESSSKKSSSPAKSPAKARGRPSRKKKGDEVDPSDEEDSPEELAVVPGFRPAPGGQQLLPMSGCTFMAALGRFAC